MILLGIIKFFGWIFFIKFSLKIIKVGNNNKNNNYKFVGFNKIKGFNILINIWFILLFDWELSIGKYGLVGVVILVINYCLLVISLS